MKFIERIKKDKDYRWKTILIFIAAVMLIGSIPEDKKQAVSQDSCNQANTGGPIFGFDFLPGYGWDQSIISIIGRDIGIPTGASFKPTQESLDLCAGARCKVGRKVLGGALTPDLYGCFTEVPNGLRAESRDDCANDGEVIDSDSKYSVLCEEFEEGTTKKDIQCTSEVQRTLAGILDSIWSTNDMSCKERYYTTAFGGGTIFLIFILAAL